MKLLFKQRFFSWLDSYDIYDESGNTVYTVEGKLAWGHKLHILNALGEHIATVKEEIFTLLPRFALYQGERYLGCISRKFGFFRPKYEVDCNGWQVEGNLFEWDYRIFDPAGRQVASVTKELFRWTDTYVIEVANPADALCALMLTLAIDAEKCSRDSN